MGDECGGIGQGEGREKKERMPYLCLILVQTRVVFGPTIILYDSTGPRFQRQNSTPQHLHTILVTLIVKVPAEQRHVRALDGLFGHEIVGHESDAIRQGPGKLGGSGDDDGGQVLDDEGESGEGGGEVDANCAKGAANLLVEGLVDPWKKDVCGVLVKGLVWTTVPLPRDAQG